MYIYITCFKGIIAHVLKACKIDKITDILYSFLALENGGIDKNICNLRVGWFLKCMKLHLQISLKVFNFIILNIIISV